MKVIVLDAPNEINNSDDALRYSGKNLFEAGLVKEEFAEECIKRENNYPTGLNCEEPVAIPHTDRQFTNDNALCVLRLKKPISFKRMDDPDETIDTKLMFNIAMHDPEGQVTIISKIIRFINKVENVRFCIDGDIKSVNELIEKEIG